jgi:hypothetical protein
MERFFNLRKEVRAEQAKEAFVEAMSEFQGECPIIDKTKKVLINDIQYFYESQLLGETAPVADRHVHPAEPRTLRLTLRLPF